jgi:tyrocidine synthetase-3
MLEPVQLLYDDFAVWQQQLFQAGEFRHEEDFWSQQWRALEDAPIRHGDIAFSRQAPPDRNGTVALCRQSIPSAESMAIKRALGTLRVTPYVYFRTALAIALSFHTGKRRLAFWANFMNRSHPELRNLIGWCANTHLLTCEVVPAMTFSEVCGSMGSLVAAARTHEALPLPALWQRMGECPDRHDTRINFDLLPNLRERHARALQLAGRPAVRGMDLDVRLQDGVDGFTILATHSSSRYSSDGVQDLVACVCRLSQAVAAQPSMRVSECLSVCSG